MKVLTLHRWIFSLTEFCFPEEVQAWLTLVILRQEKFFTIWQ